MSPAEYAEVVDVDVLVAGGGPAGIGAAIGAARYGARTMLLERMPFLGGVGAIGLGMTINQIRPGGLPRSDVHEALIAEVVRYGDISHRFEEHALITNTEYLKLGAMRALEQAGVDYLLYAFVTNAIVDSGCVVRGAVAATKAGPMRVNARCSVDATGDADLAWLAGCPTAKGREPDGFLSPMTSLFVVGGVDYERAREFTRQDRGWVGFLADARSAGYVVPERMIMTPTVYPGSVFVNHSGNRGYEVLDGTSSRDLTKAERLQRQQAVDVVRLLRERAVPGCEHAHLEQVSAWTGVRETRRVIGDYVLTEQDALSAARFPDAIARRFGFLDIGFTRYEEMTPHDVPYRALTPRGWAGILASGRNISATHVAASAGKSMGNCLATGQAAGVAAAMSALHGTPTPDLDVRRLQQALAAQGVPLES